MADTHNIPNGAPAVGFYRGPQSNLDNLSTYKNGAFYITTDSDRLYYAQSDSELVYLNKSIQVVANQTELFKINNPIPGEFYYVEEGNILCYYSASDKTNDSIGDWTQVNVQPITSSVDTLDISDATVSDDGLDFTVSLTQKNSDGSSAKTVTDTFKISKNNINALVEHPANNITISANPDATNKKYTVALGGSDATSQTSYEIAVDGSLSISGSKDAVVITGKDTHYNLDVSNGLIQVKDDSGAKAGHAVELVDDNKDIELSFSNSSTAGVDKEIKISHKVYNGTNFGDDKVAETNAPKTGETITILRGVNVSNGHVTGVTTANLTLPDTEGVTTALSNADIKEVSANNEGKITLTRNDGGTITSNEDLFYKIDGTTYYNQASLDNGLQAYIEKNLTKITNAMTFKGGLKGEADSKDINSLVTSASIGDTYIVISGFIDTNDGIASTGDIIIANGEETDGIISDISWIVVPGTKIDTTYVLDASENKIKLNDQNGNTADSIELDNDGVVVIETTESGKIKTSHAKITKVEDTESHSVTFGDTITAVESVVFDDYGHLSEVVTGEYTLPSLPDQTNDHKLAHATGLKTELQNTDGEVKGSIGFVSGNVIDITSADNGAGSNYTINHADVPCTKTENTATATNLTNNSEFVAVTGVTVNGQGHVTAYTTNKYSVTDTQYELSGDVVSAANNVATAVTSLKTKAGENAGSATLKVASNNSHLTVTASDNQINLGLVWGTF